jgi:nucleotide-binding universal stress UspA family protein
MRMGPRAQAWHRAKYAFRVPPGCGHDQMDTNGHERLRHPPRCASPRSCINQPIGKGLADSDIEGMTTISARHVQPVDETREASTADTARGVFQEIVIGADGSPEAQSPLQLALRLRSDEARLLTLSVAEVHHTWRSGLEAGDWARWLRAAAEDVSRECQRALRGVPNSSVSVVDGRPADVLLASAQSRRADLIAVGPGRGGRAMGLVFGSTATRVARESSCSVLISRGTVDLERFPQRIVVGVDGSAHAADAEAVALVLADSYGADIRRLMATGGEEFDARRVVKGELDARRPVEALVDASRDADLLIVGSRGLRGIASLGSVAERVAHRAECPVLIVRFR